MHCCGVDSYRDWLDVQWHNDIIGVIPESCCAKVHGCGGEYIVPGNYTVWTQVSCMILYLKLWYCPSTTCTSSSTHTQIYLLIN